jgi:uncharacterized Zn-finger protein
MTTIFSTRPAMMHSNSCYHNHDKNTDSFPNGILSWSSCSSSPVISSSTTNSSRCWFSETFPEITFKEVSKEEYVLYMVKCKKEPRGREDDIGFRCQTLLEESVEDDECAPDDFTKKQNWQHQEQNVPTVLSSALLAEPTHHEHDTRTVCLRTNCGKPIARTPPVPCNVEQAPLPTDFSPGPWSVAVGKEKRSYKSPGNRRLRAIIGLFLDRYANCRNNKDEKSEIISQIEKAIRGGHGSALPGAFVKYSNGRWIEVDSGVARDKISRMLRESLHTEYSSSSKQKRLRRRRML